MIINGYYCDSNGNRIDQSTLKDKIGQTQQIVKDITCLYYATEKLNEDQVLNALLGLEIFAKMRTDELLDCFNQMEHNEKLAKEEIQSHLR